MIKLFSIFHLPGSIEYFVFLIFFWVSLIFLILKSKLLDFSNQFMKTKLSVTFEVLAFIRKLPVMIYLNYLFLFQVVFRGTNTRWGVWRNSQTQLCACIYRQQNAWFILSIFMSFLDSRIQKLLIDISLCSYFTTLSSFIVTDLLDSFTKVEIYPSKILFDNSFKALSQKFVI